MWLTRANESDAKPPFRHGKNGRAACNNCSGPGAPMGGGDILGRGFDADPLFQGSEPRERNCQQQCGYCQC